jgi:glycosyltransferase involved in cell wall biosynthesis
MSGNYTKLSQLPGNALARVKWSISTYINKYLRRHVLIDSGNLPNEKVQTFLNAADSLFIPRYRALNSDNIPLGFSFNKVVVVPDIGNVGVLLNKANNPIFDPEKIDSVVEAVEAGLAKAIMGYGDANYKFAIKEMSWERISKEHYDFYVLLNSHDFNL